MLWYIGTFLACVFLSFVFLTIDIKDKKYYNVIIGALYAFCSGVILSGFIYTYIHTKHSSKKYTFKQEIYQEYYNGILNNTDTIYTIKLIKK